jgi:L-ascorbate metabolism protein UlaG (beta-lactamase superfamily)
MEITWLGGSCIRLKGREGVIAADPFRSLVGPTGRGLTADIATFSHAHDGGLEASAGRRPRGGEVVSRQLCVPVPTSLEHAFILDAPGEYEVHDIMVTAVRTYRDESKGQEHGPSVAFVFELDGLHTAHLGSIGHLLSHETLGEMGHVDVACLAIGQILSASHAAEIVAQLDASLVIPLPIAEDATAADSDLGRFLKEMSVAHPTAVPRLNVSISTLPQETSVAVLESRART